MAAIVITEIDALEPLTVAQINSVAQEVLTWDARNIETMFTQQENRPTYRWNSGHATYKDRGYPGGYSGRRFSNRKEYLTHRLSQRLTRTGILYNAEGKEEAEAQIEEIKAAKKAEREKAEAEKKAKILAEAVRPRFKMVVTVKAQIEERIPMYYDRAHKINLYMHDDDHVVMHKASDSKGQEICTERIYVKRKSLVKAIEAMTTNRSILENLPSFDFTAGDGVSFTEAKLSGIRVEGANPEDPHRSYMSTLVFNWDGENKDHILMQVQSWTFRFHIDDYANAVNAIAGEWTAVEVPQDTSTVDDTPAAQEQAETPEPALSL